MDNQNSKIWSKYFDGIGITKIGNTVSKLQDIDGAFIDINSKSLYIPLVFYKKHPEKSILLTATFDSPLFALGEDNQYYSFYRIKDAQQIGEYYVISADKIIVGPTCITTDIEEEQVKEYQLVLYYTNIKIMEQIIEGFDITYNQEIKIRLIKNEIENRRFVATLKIVSEKPAKLDNLIYRTFDLLFLYVGRMPEKIVTILNYNENKYKIYHEQVEKYNHMIEMLPYTALQKVNNTGFTLSKLELFIKFRETDDGRFLYDKFLDACNTPMYPENSCIFLIQILEGAAKKFKPMRGKEKNKEQDKKPTEENVNLKHALKCYVGNGNDYMKEVFRLSDNENVNKKKVNQLKDELRKLRNDYCHYTSSRKYKYSGIQYRDLKFRLEILIRLIFLEDFDISVNDDLFNETMRQIKNFEDSRQCNLIL